MRVSAPSTTIAAAYHFDSVWCRVKHESAYNQVTLAGGWANKQDRGTIGYNRFEQIWMKSNKHLYLSHDKKVRSSVVSCR